MSHPSSSRRRDAGPAAGPGRARTIGCVSYLNAKPLIDGLEGGADPAVRFDVPSRLLDDLEAGEVDLALCPVIDYFRSRQPLGIVPVGGIGCDGPTLTVRLFSQGPVEQIDTVFADTDSHTSVALLRVVLAERYGRRPALVDYNARERVAGGRLLNAPPPAMLLIGDKVVTDAPSAEGYPVQLDLGEAWRELTGLPFVFAVWMCRAGADLGDVPAALDRQRVHNAARIDEIAARYAPGHGWPLDLAKLYLGRLLRYDIGPDQFRAIERFGGLARRAGVIERARPVALSS